VLGRCIHYMIEAQYHTRGRARVRAHSAAGIERRPGGVLLQLGRQHCCSMQSVSRSHTPAVLHTRLALDKHGGTWGFGPERVGGAPAGRRVRARSRPVAHQKATQGRRRRATPLTVSSTRRGAAGAVFSLGTVPAAGRPLTKPCNCNAPEMAAPMRNLSASSMQLETEGPKRRAPRGRQRGTATKGLLLATTRERVMPALP
jgi:hypothetical protein